MRDIVWTRAAEADLQALYNEMEDFHEGVGHEFILLIDAALELLRHFPEMARVYDSPVRRLVVRNGRHGLFYVIEDRGIVLHAIADLRRDPEELKKRFQSVSRQGTR